MSDLKKNNYKVLVEQIKKIAQMPDIPDLTISTTKPAQFGMPSNINQHQSKTLRTRSDAVKEMQLALQHLAQVISSSIQYDKLVAAVNGKKSENPNDLQGQFGRDAFSNFMVNTYLRNSSIKGVELDPLKHNINDKQPSELKNMYVILENLRKVGSSKNEDFADGDWGPRTNNALKNVVAIADAVVGLGGNLGMNFNNFNPEEIVQLGDTSLIPNNETDIDQKQKDERAGYITKILNGISTLFIDFKNQILNNPAFANIIHGNVPVITLNKKEESQDINTQGEEKTILDDLKNNGNKSKFVMQPAMSFSVSIPNNILAPQLEGAKQVSVPLADITAADLLSPQAFEAWIKRNDKLYQVQQNNPQNWQQIIMTILDQIKSQVATKINGASSNENTNVAGY